MAQQAFYGVSPFDRHFRDDLPEVGDLHFVDAQRSAFTFGFEPVKGAISYVVEMGTVVYHPKSKLLTKEWRGAEEKEPEALDRARRGADHTPRDSQRCRQRDPGICCFPGKSNGKGPAHLCSSRRSLRW